MSGNTPDSFSWGVGEKQEAPPLKSRVDFYLRHLAYCTAFFPAGIRYVVADGFYNKPKWVSGVVQLGFHSIGRLRSDANLKFLYDGPQKRRSNRRRYDGKVNLADPSRFTFVETLAEDVSLYTAVVWSAIQVLTHLQG